ncbi:unnamed protein product, partial [Owenia fusiformis]
VDSPEVKIIKALERFYGLLSFMASFTEPNFLKKLEELNSSQQSIQTLSLWLIHHRKHSKPIVDLWLQEFSKVDVAKKLTFCYLANDVVQNSRKKGSQFITDFQDVLPDAFEECSRDADEKTKKAIRRLVDIWGERGVFGKEFIKTLKQATSKTKRGGRGARKVKDRSNDKGKTEKKDGEKSSTAEPVAKKKKVASPQLSLLEEIGILMEKNGDVPIVPPEPEVLVSSLQALEKSASGDAVVREKIAALPPEVSDPSLLSKITDAAEAKKLISMVDDACTLLADYNSRLDNELEDRKRVGKMMREYVVTQKNSLAKREEKLKEFKEKLSKVTTVRQELKSHIENLPDLTLLPDVTGGLAPLPSAGDLFSV